MFTGIVEAKGKVVSITKIGTNIRFKISSIISSLLKVDQSVAHDGVCLTVVNVENNSHEVDAIQETLDKTNLSQWKKDKHINLERAMTMDQRLDGHMVQGHVDCTAVCIDKLEKNGSWYFSFQINDIGSNYQLLVDKGSICLNGISLTVVNPEKDQFSVAIIPYTYNHTNLKYVNVGDTVNVEFDILGKYIQRHIGAYLKAMSKEE